MNTTIDHTDLAERSLTADSDSWIDRDQLLGRCMGNLELADRLIGRFGERLEETIRELEAGAARRDLTKLETVAHRLKGEAGNMGVDRLSKLASRTEEYARMGFIAEAAAAAAQLVAASRAFRAQNIGQNV